METKLKDRHKNFDKRVGCLQFGVGLFVVCLLLYLFLIQVADVRHYRDRAKFQRSSELFVLRGEILDRNGFKLASDNTSFTLYAHPRYYDYPPDELAQKLSPLVKIPVDKLTKTLAEVDNQVILIKRGLDRKTADQIKKLSLREISLEPKNKRIYPQGALASHILGFYNPDADVAGGIEYVAKDYLEYFDKNITYEKTRSGDVIYNLNTNPEDITAPIKGKTLNLTIDSAVQHICEKYLYKTIQKTNALRGAVIVLDPKTGEVLALAAYPYYDPNNYKKHSLLEMKNWAITDVYPPGSTFKVVSVASAMINGKADINTKILDTGKMKIGWWEIVNYDYSRQKSPQLIDLVYLFEHSSNVASVKIAQMMSPQEFYDTLQAFNFGQKTGIDLPGESPGILPPVKNWDVATHASMGYGYGASVTAIQMASAVAAIANKGVWITPHVIKYPEEELPDKVVSRRVMSEESAADLTKILVKSIENGKNIAKMDEYYVAAKTGTSRRPLEHGAGYSNKLYTSMVGFLPATDPKAVIYVVIDSPTGEQIWGSTVAAPVFKDICTELAKILNLNPDKKDFEKHKI